MNITKTTTFTALVLAAGFAMTGCSTDPVTEPVTEPTPVVTETVESTPVVTEPAVVTYQTGETVVWDGRASDLGRTLPENQRAYELADGTFVIVDVNEPLPDAVVAQEQANATAFAENPRGTNTVAQAERTTGKKVIQVAFHPQANGWVTAANPEAIAPPAATKAEAVAIAEAHIAAQENPANWALIVVG